MLGISLIARLEGGEVGAMPYFGDMVIVDANAPLIDFEGTHYSG